MADGGSTLRTGEEAPTATGTGPMTPVSADDLALLDRLQRAGFDYFPRHTEPANGLVADTDRDGSPCSIAVVGFALSAYPVGVERGWIARGEAVAQVLRALRFFAASDQSGSAESTGHRGFYFHFLDLKTGRRTWQSELSLIDSAVLIAGMLTAAAYFTADTADEVELRQLADTLYRRADWRWAQHEGASIRHGWKPESGFLNYGWDGYSEAILLYALGLGSPTHPCTDDAFAAWTLTYQWENLYGLEFLYAGPLFIHQLSHAWIDFRGLQDDFMREKHCDYFENSRRATYVQREYARRNPRSFRGYAADRWGLSAGDGPSGSVRLVAGRRQSFHGYAARGVPYGPDDGTIAGSSALASIVFAPEIVLPVVRQLAGGTPAADRAVLAGGFNPTFVDAAADAADAADAAGDADGDRGDRRQRGPGGDGWLSPGRFGFDQGLFVLMIENFRSGLPWSLVRGVPAIATGLRRAGFRGGWL